jgi:TPR repeat protein
MENEGAACALCATQGTNGKLMKCSRCKHVQYCSRECQAADWKNHKKLCVAQSKRKQETVEKAINSSVTSNSAPPKSSGLETEECIICMGSMSVTTKCTTLPCSHSFHTACMCRLRSTSSAQACPLCRADLPDGPEQKFVKGMKLHHDYKFEVAHGADPNSSELKSMLADVVELYTSAADDGFMMAQCNLGTIYCDGEGVPQNYEKAIELYLKAAEQGDAEAQCNLAIMHCKGQGVAQDFDKGIEWYTKASNQGDLEAQRMLGNFLLQGDPPSFPGDKASGMRWLEKAALEGNYDKAQNNLGCIYRDGLFDTVQSFQKASEWFIKAANQGDAAAQCSIGALCYGGQGVPQSFDRAAEWYKKAADQGNDLGQLYLADMYLTRKIALPDSLQRGVVLLQESAAQGNANAQNMLVQVHRQLAAQRNG